MEEAGWEPGEDFAATESWEVVPEPVSWETQQYQVMYKDLEADASSLEESRRESEQESSRLCVEVEQLHERLQQLKGEAQAVAFQEELQLAREERRQLLQERAALESELQQLQSLLTDQEVHCQVQFQLFQGPGSSSQLPSSPMERLLVFKGRTEEEAEEAALDTLSVRPRICYPLPGGTALITFESPEVARRILTLQEHRVQLDEWTFVQVKAEPVELWMPSAVEIILDQNPRQVILSGMRFPSLTEEQLLDKLELFFSKRQHQGGEVEVIQQLPGTGHVALTFVDDGVAERLIKRGQFQVTLAKETSRVKVSPYLDGKISDLQLRPSVCPRTVLLSGIPDVLGEELMREALEIHFQKATKGGGEVEAIAYVPAGRRAIAVFEREEDGGGQPF